MKSNIFKNIFNSNLFWSSLSSIIIAGYGFFIIVFIGNVSKAEGLGYVTLGLMMYSILLSFFSFGSDWVVAKFVSQHINDENKITMIITNSIVLSLFGGSLTVLFVFMFGGLIANYILKNSDYTHFIQIFGIACGVAIVAKPLLGYFTGIKDLRTRSLVEIGKFMTIIFLIIFFFYFYGENLMVIPGSMLISEIVFGILLLIIYNSYIKINNKWKINYKTIRILLISGAPLSFTPLLQRLGSRIDVFMISHFIGIQAVGIYSFVIMIPEATTIFSSAIQKISAPRITELYYSKNNEIQTYIDNTMKYCQIIYSIIAIVVFTMAWEIPLLLYPDYDSYIQGVFPLRIFLITMVIIGTYGGISFADNLCAGKSYVMLYRVITLVILNTILNYFLIPRYQLIGAAMATLFTYIVIFFMGAYYRKKNLGVYFNWEIYLGNFSIFIIIIFCILALEKQFNNYVILLAGLIVLTSIYFCTGNVKKTEFVDYIKGLN